MDSTLENPRSTLVGLKAMLMAIADGLTVSAAAALHSLVTFALSMMRTRACMFEGHVTVLVSPAKLEFAQVAIPTYRV